MKKDGVGHRYSTLSQRCLRPQTTSLSHLKPSKSRSDTDQNGLFGVKDGALRLPDTGACPEEVYQAPEPPREPSASERPPLSPEHGDPEWAGSAEEAAGAPVQLQARVAREPGLDERALQAWRELTWLGDLRRSAKIY